MDKVKSILVTALDWIKTHKKIVIVALVVIVVALLGVNLFSGKAQAKRAVKSYISALNKADTDKILKALDAKGYYAWNECDEDEDDFNDEYDDLDDGDADDAEELLKFVADYWCDGIDDDYDKYSIKVDEIKSVEKEASGLYKVKAKLKITTEKDDDEDTTTDTVTFYVYKGKVIAEGNYVAKNSWFYYINDLDTLESTLENYQNLLDDYLDYYDD